MHKKCFEKCVCVGGGYPTVHARNREPTYHLHFISSNESDIVTEILVMGVGIRTFLIFVWIVINNLAIIPYNCFMSLTIDKSN